MSTITLDQVTPPAGIRGGHITARCQGLHLDALDTCSVLFGTTPSRPACIAPTLVIGTIPPDAETGTVQLAQGDVSSNTLPFHVGTVLAENLHPVASPAVDRHGMIFTTISGTKGQQVPTSLYRITPTGDPEPFVSGILNPTGLAFAPDGALYVSSRHTGKVLRVNESGTVSPVAENLGIVTGLAFNSQGQLYAGDRRGTIYHLSETGEARPFVSDLEPSVTAYHLAFDDDDRLYVSYPTLSGSDAVICIAPDGTRHTVIDDLGRAQGLAFDTAGNLYIVAHIAGAGGVIKRTPDGTVEHLVTAPNLIGVAFGLDGEMFLTDNSALYRLDLGIHGRLLA
jgi:sugar lactone lactonase YvrE